MRIARTQNYLVPIVMTSLLKILILFYDRTIIQAGPIHVTSFMSILESMLSCHTCMAFS